nr:gliding motility-associated C-terminal domain-containing protein [Ferruginibacter sp.]
FNGTNVQLYSYIVTGTAANGCTAKDTVNIRINAQPVVSTIGNTSICKGDSIQLVTNSTAQTNTWTPALSVNNPNIANPYFTDTVNQQMIITGTNATGCFAKDTVTINVKPTPIVKTIENVNTCATNTVTLFTTGAQTYSWTPGTNLNSTSATNPVFTGLGTYTYHVTGTAANGCIGKDSVIISIGNKPTYTAPASRTICNKDSVQLDGNNGTAYAYSWSPGTSLTNATIRNPIAYPQVTTTYTLKVSDAICLYDSTFLVQVIVNPLPAVKASRSKDIDCNNPSSNLTATGAIQYQWLPLAGLNDYTIPNPVASPPNTTKYIVIGTDANGCKAKDSVVIYVKGGQYFSFNIPNAFTPNGDTKNDCFGVPYWGSADQFSMIIYNRWGIKVFESKNVSDCWDGKIKGLPADAGNYVYYISAHTLCGYISKKGNVLLVR